MNFHLHEKAFQEYLAAADWYEEREYDLREDFISEVEQAIAAILSDPGRFPFVRKKFRIARVHRFPYSIFFEFDPTNHTVYIHSIFHQRRLPGSWMTRKFDIKDPS